MLSEPSGLHPRMGQLFGRLLTQRAPGVCQEAPLGTAPLCSLERPPLWGAVGSSSGGRVTDPSGLDRAAERFTVTA